jgi:hypothetical protein
VDGLTPGKRVQFEVSDGPRGPLACSTGAHHPRVVKRAISNYVAKTANGRIRGPSRNATIEIDILAIEDP